MKRQNLLGIFVILFFVFSIAQQYYVYQKTAQAITNFEEPHVSGKASTAVLTLCINSPPSFNNTCPNSTLEHQLYLCKINGTDANNDQLTFNSSNLTSTMPFNISRNGTIRFTPNQTYVGNHLMNISVQDSSGCSNGFFSSLFNFTIINVNDPPYLDKLIPDQEFDKDVNIYAFYLSEYFKDPENDPMNYFFVFDTGSTLFNITINNDSQVVISASQCIEGYIYFVAVDTGNLTGISNNVHLKVNCVDQGQTGQQDTGGGGGSGANRVCTPDWRCTNWGPCLPNGSQERRCVDYNGCNPNDYIRYMYQACKYDNETVCEENWECTEWTACIDGNQTRTCTDKNHCGTFTLQPNVTRSCEKQQPGNVTIPTVITPPVPGFPWLTYILIVAILLVAILLILYKFYRKEINEILVRIGWYFSKKRKKTILITDDTKDKLLKKLFEIEKSFGKIPLEKTAYSLAGAVRSYMSEAFKLEYEYTPESFLKAWQVRKIDELLKSILKSYAEQLYAIEFNKTKPVPHELITLLDEFRLIIFQTSNATKEDGAQQVKQRTTSSRQPIDHLLTLISNSIIPTQFNETVYGKKFYFQALKLFETLKISEQQIAYPPLHRLYQEINYVSHLIT